MKWLGYIVAGLLLLTGVIWFLQGISILPGSFMTGQIQWAFAGLGSILIGAGLIRWIRQRD